MVFAGLSFMNLFSRNLSIPQTAAIEMNEPKIFTLEKPLCNLHYLKIQDLLSLNKHHSKDLKRSEFTDKYQLPEHGDIILFIQTFRLIVCNIDRHR